jgi:branched-chain amino acid transport system ATP-binding protein
MDLLKIENVLKNFGGLTALRNVDLSVSEGQIKSIIGPNGAGKTTLFNVISGFYRPDQGAIHFCDQDITGKSPESISRLGLARTFQIVKPFLSMSVQENVMIGSLSRTSKTPVAKIMAMEVLENLGMAEKGQMLAKNLTIEDRKRLELARAMATGPKLVLLDEVMSGLNPTETEEMMELIRKIRSEGVTVLLIEHVMQAVLSLSDEVVVLNYGEKIYEGDTQGVIRDRGVIEAYLGEEYFLT